MLPSKNRILRKDFPTHKMQGFRTFSPFFTAVFYKPSSKGVHTGSELCGLESRASVVVSKKTAKTAVVRNRLRRRFYELLDQNFKKLLTPTTIVVYPRIDAHKATFEELSREVEKAFRLAKLIK
ncbi:ribonuclease P protein component [Patescibacteria group bacterium]|nr:MAG: ribonuclease P protein component [Patescibacteria group bacterium]